MVLEDSVQKVKGAGAKTAQLLEKLGIRTVQDLLCWLPRYYKDLREIVGIGEVKMNQECTVKGKVITQPRRTSFQGKIHVFQMGIQDETGAMNICFFNQPYLMGKFQKGKEYLFFGKVKYHFKGMQMDNPAVYPAGERLGILPFYGLTQGLTQKKMRLLIENAWKECEITRDYSFEFLREVEIEKEKDAYRKIHCPQNMEEKKAGLDGMIFRELLVFNRVLQLLEQGDEELTAPAMEISEETDREYFGKLPFAPTGAQLRTMKEIREDLGKERAMNRLVQGDVGSGKTAIAFYAMYAAMKAGYQSAMMAPTEILARQHYEKAVQLFGEENVALIRGGQSKRERESILRRIRLGEVWIAIGTHALLFEELAFPDLGLIVTDEQHRFGVKQRAKLSGNSLGVHTLTMSATPIPRTLALILYGKADVSVVDELPPGRKQVKTHLVGPKKRNDMYRFIKERIAAGEQAYVVCPLIENSDSMEIRSVVQVLEEIQGRFPGISCAMLHGKLRPGEKQEIMERFAAGDTKLLISTTVIEVGVNVPNATMMVVENAERFGLAQLHQLRGRVGRGEKQAYCFLLPGTPGSLERLRILKETGDGFVIAQKDLELRGAGELVGIRQHGTDGLQVSDLIRDIGMLKRTQKILRDQDLKERFPADFARVDELARKQFKNQTVEIVLS